MRRLETINDKCPCDQARIHLSPSGPFRETQGPRKDPERLRRNPTSPIRAPRPTGRKSGPRPVSSPSHMKSVFEPRPSAASPACPNQIPGRIPAVLDRICGHKNSEIRCPKVCH